MTMWKPAREQIAKIIAPREAIARIIAKHMGDGMDAHDCADEILARTPAAQEAQESQIDLLAKRIAGAELNYRNSYQVNGASHIETGRRWDKMRKAGDAIRQYFFEREEADDCACGGGNFSGHDTACPYYSVPSAERHSCHDHPTRRCTPDDCCQSAEGK